MIRVKDRITRAQPGQVLLIFALMNLVLLAGLGLVLDAGYDFAQRRTMQNAADAAALAGVHDILNGATPATIVTDIVAIAGKNGVSDPARVHCTFVSNAEASLGACGSVVSLPAGTSGVTVTVGETHQTFVLRAVGIGTSGTGATATAHVESVPPSAFDAGDGPFIVCGYQTYLDDGGELSILQTDASGKALVVDGQAQINPDAVGKTFNIHGPQVATCSTQGNRFKGDNDQDANRGITVSPTGTPINYLPGDRAGPMRNAVHAVKGCSNEPDDPGPCIMILPLADNVSVDCGNCKTINVVGYAAFQVSDSSANSNTGILLNNVVLQAPGTLTWTPSTKGLTSIHLTK
ncbi:MAG TPA: pilus assembly protein TadG-related protein [Thermomicrobiales bacterium]|nr:pilus assembly protein TadG-related protein [Thermomicrobiales bacterium]